MPSDPRRNVVDPDVVGVYHVWGRCVRQAWLLGDDRDSHVDNSHRRDWIEQLQQQLAALFAIEIEFHAELSNHLHLVLRTRPDIVRTWSDEDAVRRMLTVHKIIHSNSDDLVQPSIAEIQLEMADPNRVTELRGRLKNLSWFMKALRETIARRANSSDGISGAFWDGRFKCRRLLDETAILVCGIYVDLNQIRAGEAATPETSKHTSVFQRIRSWQLKQPQDLSIVPPGETDVLKANTNSVSLADAPDGWLGELTLEDGPGASESEWNMRSRTGRRASDKGLLPLPFEKYLGLLEWTGRQVHEGKRGVIPDHLAPILDRLRIRRGGWLDLVEHFESRFKNFAGHVDELRQAAIRAGKRCLRGIRECSKGFL